MKKLLSLLLALAMVLALAACGSTDAGEPASTEEEPSQTTEESGEAETEEEEEGAAQPEEDASTEEGQPEETESETADAVVTRIGSLKGPTSIGLVKLMSDTEMEETPAYTFTMEADASALLTGMVAGDLDVALIPANAAAIWYGKVEGGVTCIDVNTLGVLYIISADDSIASIEDLAGKTVYLPGQGTSPDYVFQYLLAQHDMSLEDVTVEYKSEGTEVIAALTADPEGIGLLPQPAVTAAVSKLEGFSVVLDLTEEWGKVCDTDLLTGVTVVRNDFLNEHPEAVDQFLIDHQLSTSFVAEDVAGAAQLTADTYGIMDNATVAEKAIPACNVTYIDGAEMQAMVNAYLQVLYDLEPSSVGGAVPGDDFYYLG